LGLANRAPWRSLSATGFLARAVRITVAVDRALLVAVNTLDERTAMDFIERIFGISPDGGSGLFEFILFAVPLAGIAFLYLRRRARRTKNQK
jgi:hypothetical protein